MLGQLARSASALTVVGRCRQQRHRLHRCALRCMAAKQVEVSHILLSQENKSLVPKFRKSIAAGEETLASLASEHSQCPSRGYALLLLLLLISLHLQTQPRLCCIYSRRSSVPLRPAAATVVALDGLHAGRRCLSLKKRRLAARLVAWQSARRGLVCTC
jgi:hypothetical protein